MMLRHWVSANLLENLDAALHQKEVLELLKKIHRFTPKTIDSMGGKVTKGATPTTLGFRYEEDGVRFIRSQNVLDNSVEGPFLCISSECHQFMRRSQVQYGDLLINLVGASIGRTAVYPFREPANTNQAVGKVRLPDMLDSHFLSTWIGTPYVQKLIAAQQSGQARDNFDLYQVRSIKIPTFHINAQRYIGGKVRQAERFREVAQKREAAFNDLIGTAYPEIDEPFGGLTKHGRAPASLVDGTLNPGEFNPDRMKVREYLQQHGGKVLKDVATVETPVVATYSPSDPYIGLDSIGSSCGTLTPSTIANETVIGAVRTLPEGPVISKLRPYLNKVAYIPTELAGALGSTELLCVRPNDQTRLWPFSPQPDSRKMAA